MTDTVAAASIGVAGAVVVAVVTVIAQLGITRAVIRAEREKVDQQSAAEESSQRRTRREERLLDAIAELLTSSDPQTAPGIDYGRAVSLIHRIQLQLDLAAPDEAGLNDAINQLGLRLQDYHGVQGRKVDDKISEMRALLVAQARVADLARRVIAKTSVQAT
jgi:hypothetical protein